MFSYFYFKIFSKYFESIFLCPYKKIILKLDFGQIIFCVYFTLPTPYAIRGGGGINGKKHCRNRTNIGRKGN
jgi:hypothetical protein